MKVRVKTKDLKQAVALHKKIKPGKNLCILAGVMLEANKCLEISNTNLEQTLKTKIESEVIEPGKAIIPFKVLENTVKCSKEDIIELESIDNKLRLNKLKANTLSLDEFPKFPEFKDGKTLKHLDYTEFINSLLKISKFRSKDESRAILTGIYFDTKDNCLVATDSYRLGLSKFYFNRDIGTLVMPGICIDILKNIKEKKFEMLVDESNIYFHIGRHTLVTRVLTGKFPEYKQLMPDSGDYIYKFKTADMIDKVKQADNMININNENIPVRLKFNTVEVSIIMENKEVGEFSDTVEIVTLKNKDKKELVFNFSPYFLNEGLANFNEVSMYVTDPLKPIIFKNNEELKYLLMPIRVN